MPFKNTYTTFDDVECGLVSIHDGFCLPLHLEKCQVFVEVCSSHLFAGTVSLFAFSTESFVLIVKTLRF